MTPRRVPLAAAAASIFGRARDLVYGSRPPHLTREFERLIRDLLETLTTLPVPLILMLALGLALWRRRGASVAVIGLASLSLIALSLPPAARALQRPLATAAIEFGSVLAPAPRAIVVPTAGIFADSDGGWWSSADGIRRAVAGRRLRIETGLPLILIGGAPYGEGQAEAAVVAGQVGLGGAEVIVEGTARNTAETAAAVARIMSGLGGERVVLVTSPIHVARMAASLRGAGLGVVIAPAAPVARPRPLGGVADFVPSANALAASSAAVREYTAILWYLIKGHFRLIDLLAVA
ncbi:MAG: YdcF family protein [Alphaproteobacteria bacterium]|nr:YdcF family protein [Alphaproteobacteria bacterium]